MRGPPCTLHEHLALSYLVLGHTQQCSGLPPGSMLRNPYWWASGAHTGCRGWKLYWPRAGCELSCCPSPSVESVKWSDFLSGSVPRQHSPGVAGSWPPISPDNLPGRGPGAACFLHSTSVFCWLVAAGPFWRDGWMVKPVEVVLSIPTSCTMAVTRAMRAVPGLRVQGCQEHERLHRNTAALDPSCTQCLGAGLVDGEETMHLSKALLMLILGWTEWFMFTEASF